jgi:hypothetical protein
MIKILKIQYLSIAGLKHYKITLVQELHTRELPSSNSCESFFGLWVVSGVLISKTNPHFSTKNLPKVWEKKNFLV